MIRGVGKLTLRFLLSGILIYGTGSVSRYRVLIPILTVSYLLLLCIVLFRIVLVLLKNHQIIGLSYLELW